MTRMVGQYEIRDLLGEGGIGQVHAAYDTILQREVAMKSLRPELLSDANFVERFRSEATSLARLNHPNITTLYSLFPDGRNLYMVMELVRGSTLDSILEKRKVALDIRECLAIIAQAADGLDYAHSMGVIHRDIKPSNLIVSGNGTLKIMDFGIARVRGSQRLTRSGSIVGTLAYMAPEQLRGEEGDDSCDLYSLAIVLYEMLSGAPPFNAASEYDLMQAQINQKPDRLTPKVAALDPKIENALLKALSKKPDQRYPSMRLQRRAGRVHAADGCAENPAQRYAADRSSCGADSAAVRAERRRDGRAGKHSGIEQATAGPACRRARRRQRSGRCARHYCFSFLPLVKASGRRRDKNGTDATRRNCRGSDPGASRRGRTTDSASADRTRIFGHTRDCNRIRARPHRQDASRHDAVARSGNVAGTARRHCRCR